MNRYGLGRGQRPQVDPNQTQLDFSTEQPPADDPSRFNISPEQAEINKRGIAHVRGVLADNANARQQQKDSETAASRASSPRDSTGRVIIGGRAMRVLGPPAPTPPQPEPKPPRTVGDSGKTPRELIAEGYAAEKEERKNKGNNQ